MHSQLTVTVAVLLCASLLLVPASARPYSGQLTPRDRQLVMHYATEIVRVVMGEAAPPAEQKRNSGMLDAVMNMPNLYNAGRK